MIDRHRHRRAQQREVARLLADARHTGPIPPEVSARLEGVLADLAAGSAARTSAPSSPSSASSSAPSSVETGGEHRPSAGPVADLAARRRHRARTLLVAAAAAVAIGIGVDQLVTSPMPGGSGSSASSTADRAAPAPGRSGAQGGGQPGGSAGGSAGGHRPHGSTPQQLTNDPQAGPRGPLLTVRPDHFSDDAARALRRLTRLHASESAGTLDLRVPQEARKGGGGTLDRAARLPAGCRGTGWGPGRLVGVRYDHAPAVLVLRPRRGDTLVVDLYRCGSTEPLRSTTLPVR